MATVYSSLKFLGYPDRLDALRERRVMAPVHVRIKPINRCNHHCWYCAYRSDDLALGAEMDERDVIAPERMREIADDLVAIGVRAVTFSGGGEPLLYKPLPGIVERLAAGGVRVAALTNGANLQGRMAEALAQHATWVRVSVDAWDDASYVASRSARDGDFGRLLDNLRAFAARGSRCVLGISFIVGRDNHHRLDEVCRLFKECGVSHVKLSAAVVGNSVAENNRYHREFAAAAAAAIERARRLEAPGFAVIDHFHDLPERFEKTYTRCPFLQFLTVIGADLQVYTCQDKAYISAGRLGSIRDRSFADFWFSEENRARLLAFDPSVSCRHHCVAHAKNLAILDYLSLDPEHAVFV